ncbi:MAG TPA: ATP-binding protein, partial [Kofleriaceae bacterium]|nr:ATP-binding protein [Kofleriaceae bacterium]
RARAVQRSNRLLAGLLEMSEALQSALHPDDIRRDVAESAPARLGTQVRVFRAQGEKLDLSFETGAAWCQAAEALWASKRATHVSPYMVAHLLRGSTGPLGVLIAERDETDVDEPAHMTALANLVALALERAELSEAIGETRAQVRSEELKTALLSSVSHDFRTPLTTISASATSLVEYADRIDPLVRDQLLRSIVDECEWLNRYTANLLEMSKLQAGAVIVNAQVVDAAEMLGAAIKRVRPRLAGRVIERDLPNDPVLVRVDVALFELVLVNVLENAVVYSGEGTRIAVTLSSTSEEVAIDVRDEGTGIPPADLDRVFARFQRGPRTAGGARGSGLGLAIARGFVEAFGGRIWAEVPGLDGRGTHIAIRLPLVEEAAA